MTNLEKRNRIREALVLRGMKQVELCELTGIKKSSVNNWLSQRWQPKQDALMRMAKVLDVSEMWLAGYDVPMERPIEQKKSDELAQLIHSIRSDNDLKDMFLSLCTLTSDQRDTIKSMITELTKINSLH